jgi:hypothetical protein
MWFDIEVGNTSYKKAPDKPGLSNSSGQSLVHPGHIDGHWTARLALK